MRLSRELHYTLAELLDSLDDGEFELQLAFNRKTPLPNPWTQTARIEAAICNYAGKIASSHVDYESLIPIQRDPPTADQLYTKFLAMIAGAGVEVIDNRR